jgi:undecaprenyl diphosphate synthase
MHIAIIMDGNGRWAARRGLPRTAGHRAGAKAVDTIVAAAARRCVNTLTLYAFSGANWRRPREEVTALFTLFRRYLLTQTRRCLKQAIRINVIGRRDRLSGDLCNAIEASETATAHCSGMHLRIAIDYSAQDSLIETCRRLSPEQAFDRQRFIQCLAEIDRSTSPAAAVDLLIRTGGEKRLSDFMLWECAYAELYFTDCSWPDFDESMFEHALVNFAGRERRFGAIGTGAGTAEGHG